MKTDYEAMWKSLKENLKMIYNGMNLSDFKLDDFQSGSRHAIKAALNQIEVIESKHSPKQYNWSEILSMNPLPKKIESVESESMFSLSGAETTYWKPGYMFAINPTISEMQNKWIIVEE